MTHMKTTKRILHYIKGTLDFGLFYSSSNNFKPVDTVIVIRLEI